MNSITSAVIEYSEQGVKCANIETNDVLCPTFNDETRFVYYQHAGSYVYNPVYHKQYHHSFDTNEALLILTSAERLPVSL